MTTTAPTPAFAAPLLHLVCHPATPTPVVHRLEATIRANPDGSLGLFYCLRGDIARLRIPEDCAPERMDQLWEHRARARTFIIAMRSRSLCRAEFPNAEGPPDIPTGLRLLWQAQATARAFLQRDCAYLPFSAALSAASSLA